MIQHLVKRFKAPPKQIGIVPAPETGRWKFVNQHGDVGRLNQVNLPRLPHCSEAKSKIFFHKKHVVVNVDHPLVGIFQESIGISQQSFGDFFPQDTSSGRNSFTCLDSRMTRLKLSTSVLFYANCLYKTRQTPVLYSAPGKGCKHGRVPAERHIPRRRASRAASRHHGRGNVLGKGINLIHCALKGSVD
ncbi:uncharacterized protein TNCV_2057591 [Trichonephila clavipes]|nr:uncharacterized protein TNCV_2057591 [Trichonephila clavipes]